MTIMNLDIAVLPDSHVVWKISPGKTYRFLEKVINSSVVFLDIRNLDEIIEKDVPGNEESYLAAISADRNAREQERIDRGVKGAEIRSGSTRNDKRKLTYLKALRHSINKGDLIVLPVDSWSKEVLIGEVLDDSNHLVRVKANDGVREFNYFGRRVRWLPSIEKRHLSIDLINHLHSQTALFTIRRDLFEEIYQVAYVNFIYGSKSFGTLFMNSETFGTQENLIVALWLNGAMRAIENVDHSDVFERYKRFRDIGLDDEVSIQSQLSININSPGKYTIVSAGTMAAVLIGIFIYANEMAKHKTIEQLELKMRPIGNVPIVACQHQVQREMEAVAKALGSERFEQLCVEAVKARERANLSEVRHTASARVD
jgi:hypothetical protein